MYSIRKQTVDVRNERNGMETKYTRVNMEKGHRECLWMEIEEDEEGYEGKKIYIRKEAIGE